LKQVFELIWYSGFTEFEAAELLEVSERTIRRRWRDARIQVQQRLTLCPSTLNASAAS
jgi:DNA-directed RNA polymerase specialized sigma24 family protein